MGSLVRDKRIDVAVAYRDAGSLRRWNHQQGRETLTESERVYGRADAVVRIGPEHGGEEPDSVVELAQKKVLIDGLAWHGVELDGDRPAALLECHGLRLAFERAERKHGERHRVRHLV